MKAGTSPLAPRLAVRALGFAAAAALAVTPLFGCAGHQRRDNTGAQGETTAGTNDNSGSIGSESGMGTPGGGQSETTGTGMPGHAGTGQSGTSPTGPNQSGTGATGQGEPGQQNAPVVVTILPKSGSTMSGTATFTSENGKVSLKVDVKGVPAGVHAVHIHENPDCTSADGESAGPHWNPTKDAHGKWGKGPHHMGDIGNLTVGSDGNGTLSFDTDQWSLGTGQSNDVAGHAIVVHSKADDFATQPSGAAGSRIGCGVVQRK